MKLLLFLPTLLLSVSCSSLSFKPAPKPDFPVMNGATAKFKKGLSIDSDFKPSVGTLTGNTWDMKGGSYEFIEGHCDNTEKGEKVIIWRDNLTIKNGKFSHWEDGVNLRAKNVTFKNIIFENCEDAFNTGVGCENFTISNCYFAPHSKKESTENYQADKLIQAVITKGNNTIENCTFWNGMCGIRIGLKKYSGSKFEGMTQIKNNNFVMLSTAIHQVRGEIKMSENKFSKVAQEFKKEI